MRTSDLLIFTTCYNERENIGRLLDEIDRQLPHADILVVDDNSPDGTWDVIQERAANYPQLRSIKRPRKLGIGSAHKYAIFYALREGYRTLVTMDADFSTIRDICRICWGSRTQYLRDGFALLRGGGKRLQGLSQRRQPNRQRRGAPCARGQAQGANHLLSRVRRGEPAAPAASPGQGLGLQLRRPTRLPPAAGRDRAVRSADPFHRPDPRRLEDPAHADPSQRARPLKARLEAPSRRSAISSPTPSSKTHARIAAIASWR